MCNSREMPTIENRAHYKLERIPKTNTVHVPQHLALGTGQLVPTRAAYR
jgi:hypothetical protein